MSKLPLIVAGSLFGLIALIHLFRIFHHFSVMVNGVEVPYFVNFIAFFVLGALSLWMFAAAKRS